LKTFNISICYTRYVEITDETIDLLLGALADQLQALGSHVEIVVIGGSALTALGLVRRATRDVDLLAIAENGELRLAEPLPQALLAARATVAADFGLAEDWLNPGANGPAQMGAARGFYEPRGNQVLRDGPRGSLCRPVRPDSLQALCHG
jgi:hypothetical protein